MQVKENTYIVIQSFMVNELHLSGNELITFAAIYGFSQDGESWFTGSRSYLAAWCQTSKKTISNNLAKLVEKGLIEKRVRNENGVTLCDYRVYQNLAGVYKKLVGGREKSSPHTIEVDNLEEKIERDIEKTPKQGFGTVEDLKPHTVESSQGSGFNAEPGTGQGITQPETLFPFGSIDAATEEQTAPNSSGQGKTKKGKREPRHRFGEYQNVLLSDSDRSKLEAEFPSDWRERIERLDEYMESTGKSYKNHLATIRAWARKDKTGASGVLSRSKGVSCDKGNQGWALEVNQGQTVAEAQAEQHRSVREQNAAQEWTEDQLKAFAEMGI